MAREIERKFLVTGEGWRDGVTSTRSMRQFYLARTDAATVRVRIVEGETARFTVKSTGGGMARDEFEWDIPVEDASAMEAMAQGRVIAKTRAEVPFGGFVWEVDAFEGGLVMAEIELPSEDAAFDRPDWIGAEVTGDPAYYNAAMALGSGADQADQ